MGRGMRISRRASVPVGPALQVICLGSGGGPAEDNVTGFLVRAMSTNWGKNSLLAVDAGSHLAAITRILQKDFDLVANTQGSRPASRTGEGNGNGNGQEKARDNNNHDESSSPRTANMSGSEDSSSTSSLPYLEEEPPIIRTLDHGPFAGLPFPHASARANALHVVKEHVSTYLITHPHLDHVSALAINSASFHNTSKPKTVAALPFTINALKRHIFNDSIWPNLTDEDGGVGFLTFRRLQEGGSIAIGTGSGTGYIEVCDGILVRAFCVSHGHCMHGPGHIHRGSVATLPETLNVQRTTAHPTYSHADAPATDGREARSHSFSMATQSGPGTPLLSGHPDPGRSASLGAVGTPLPNQPDHCVIDSSAYFIRSEATDSTPCREVLIFGDVEPDSISLSPRTALVWAEAAPKVASHTLTGIFIECSYTNTQGDAVLYGHLSPRHLLAELQNLAAKVKEARREREKEKELQRKRKKTLTAETSPTRRKSVKVKHDTDDESMTESGSLAPVHHPPPMPHGGAQALQPSQATLPTPMSHASASNALNLSEVSAEHSRALLSVTNDNAPLRGVKVVIIHVKDTLADGPPVGEHIVRELQEGEQLLAGQGKGLGCEFELSESGKSYFF